MRRSRRYSRIVRAASLLSGLAAVAVSPTAGADTPPTTPISGAAKSAQTKPQPQASPDPGAVVDLGDPSKLSRETGTGEYVEELPGELRGIEIDEKVGAEVPRDIGFRDENGASVTLAKYLNGNLPVILTFNYTNCPLLCSVQLNALQSAMKQLTLRVGQQYQIVTISLDPKETPDIAASTKDKFVRGFTEAERPLVRRGWHFLTGDEQAIKAMADAVGFGYRYLAKTKEYLHPATLIFLSPNGAVTRYFHGVHYESEQLNSAIVKSAVGEHGVSFGFILSCFRYNPDADSYARTGELAMRYGALGFVVIFAAGFGVWQVRRTRRRARAAVLSNAADPQREAGFGPPSGPERGPEGNKTTEREEQGLC